MIHSLLYKCSVLFTMKLVPLFLQNGTGQNKNKQTKVNERSYPFNKEISAYTTAKKKRPNQLGYLVGIWL